MREVDRLEVIREVVGKRLVQREAGERLRLRVRQVKRLVRRYRELGAKGLISGHRGRKASNAIASEARAEILAVVRERYERVNAVTSHWQRRRSRRDGNAVRGGPPGEATGVTGRTGFVGGRQPTFLELTMALFALKNDDLRNG